MELLSLLPWAELCLDLLKGMGVPCGEMKGVLHSEVEPNVAAREMSDEDELYGWTLVTPLLPPLPPPCTEGIKDREEVSDAVS